MQMYRSKFSNLTTYVKISVFCGTFSFLICMLFVCGVLLIFTIGVSLLFTWAFFIPLAGPFAKGVVRFPKKIGIDRYFQYDQYLCIDCKKLFYFEGFLVHHVFVYCELHSCKIHSIAAWSDNRLLFVVA